jgi:hypothetical protein
MGYGLDEEIEIEYEGSDFANEQEAREMRSRHAHNKKAAVGSMINCAACSKRMKKKSYQTQYCSNKGRGNCKDQYWNVVENRFARLGWF